MKGVGDLLDEHVFERVHKPDGRLHFCNEQDETWHTLSEVHETVGNWHGEPGKALDEPGEVANVQTEEQKHKTEKPVLEGLLYSNDWEETAFPEWDDETAEVVTIHNE